MKPPVLQITVVSLSHSPKFSCFNDIQLFSCSVSFHNKCEIYSSQKFGISP